MNNTIDISELNTLVEPVVARADPSTERLDAVRKSAEQHSTYNLNGFIVHDETVVGSALKAAEVEHVNRRNHYLKAKKELEDGLANAGIRAKAYLPNLAWRSILDLYGLKTFCPAKNGEVAVSTYFVGRRIEKSVTIGQWLSFMFFVWFIAATNTVMPMNWWGKTDPVYSTWFSLFGFVVAASALGFLISRKVAERLAARAYHSATDAERYDLLFPTDPKRFSWQWQSKTKVVFPEPPQRVTDLLIKIRDLRISDGDANTISLKIATDFSSVRFDPPVETLIKSAYGEHRTLERDPILFVEHNGCVAVLEQYGESPFERQAISELFDNRINAVFDTVPYR